MIFVRFRGPGDPLPLGTRILLTLGGILVLSFLFFFAFTFFVIALIAGGIGLLAQLVFGRNRFSASSAPVPPGFHRRDPHRDDDDVIDV